MIRRTSILLAVSCAATAVAAGCGGGDGGPELTHAELVARMNQVCSTLAQSTAALDPPFRPYSEQSEPFFASFHDGVERAKEELDELNPPSADAEALGRLVDGYEEIRMRLEAAQVAAATGQDQEFGPLFGELEQHAADVRRAERQLGVCRGKISVRVAVVRRVERTTENPLGETGELGG